MLRSIVGKLRGKEQADVRARMKPAFIIIGAQKSGTTALFDYLARHPATAAPDIKEIDFFNCDSRYGMGPDFYHSHFPELSPATEGKVTFEATPGYLFNANAPGRMHGYNAGLKLIAILREPIERAYSAWNMYQKRYAKDRGWFAEWMRRCDKDYDQHPYAPREVGRFNSFTHVVEEEMAALERGVVLEAPILKHGCYHEQVERYWGLFGADHMLVLENNSFRSDTTGALREVEAFTGLPPHDWSTEDTAPVFEGSYDSAMPSDAREMLAAYYDPHNAKLFEMLGRSFDWDTGLSQSSSEAGG